MHNAHQIKLSRIRFVHQVDLGGGASSEERCWLDRGMSIWGALRQHHLWCWHSCVPKARGSNSVNPVHWIVTAHAESM